MYIFFKFPISISVNTYTNIKEITIFFNKLQYIFIPVLLQR